MGGEGGGGCRTNELSKMVKGLRPPHLPGETRGKLDRSWQREHTVC